MLSVNKCSNSKRTTEKRYDMSRLEDNFRKVEPYVPGEQPNLPDMVKLNTNENPYPPSPNGAEV